MARPFADIPGYDPRTPEQMMRDHDLCNRYATVDAIVKDLEEYLPEFREMHAKTYLQILARVRRHRDMPTETR